VCFIELVCLNMFLREKKYRVVEAKNTKEYNFDEYQKIKMG